jgi:hypothetical protein
MMSLIDALHANAAIKDVDLIDRAWLLGDPPLARVSQLPSTPSNIDPAA